MNVVLVKQVYLLVVVCYCNLFLITFLCGLDKTVGLHKFSLTMRHVIAPPRFSAAPPSVLSWRRDWSACTSNRVIAEPSGTITQSRQVFLSDSMILGLGCSLYLPHCLHLLQMFKMCFFLFSPLFPTCPAAYTLSDLNLQSSVSHGWAIRNQHPVRAGHDIVWILTVFCVVSERLSTYVCFTRQQLCRHHSHSLIHLYCLL